MANRTHIIAEMACSHEGLDFEVETIKDGDVAYVPLSEPLQFENGKVWNELAPFGQSVCVLVRK